MPFVPDPFSQLTADFGQPDYLSLGDLTGALTQALPQAGVDKLDLIGFDACLMGQLDVFQPLAPFADFAVGSEELTPGSGWDYRAILGQLADEPAMDGSRLAQQIAANFVDYYTLVEPDDFVTMTAVNLAQMDEVETAVTQLAQTLAADPANSDVVYAGSNGNGIFRSEDKGRTWAPWGLEGQIVKALAVSPHDPETIYAGLKPAMMAVSRDGGQSWQELESFRRIRGRRFWFSPAEPPDKRPYVQAITISPTEPDVVLAGIEFGAVVRSEDGGRTWSDVQTTHFAKGIRNMQLSGKLGELYFMHGRSGSYPRDLVGDDPGPGNFVLYSSRDGIHWDEGIVLMSRMQTPGGGDCYSANEVIGKYDPATPERLLIHADVSYSGAKTNMHQWWVTTTPWASQARAGGTTRD